MSGIAGVFHRDGRPADSRLLSAMMRAAPHLGPDGARYWTDGSVGLCHQLLRASPEARLDRQPLADAHGVLWITFDGRLDNRDELATALGEPALRHAPDVAIALAAYAQWDDRCAERLLGDFAFALWDLRRRRLFCARDVMAIRPFYYALDENRFIFGSDLRQVLAGCSPDLHINEGMIAEHLAREIRNQEETLYQEVLRLPSAHSLVVESDRVKKRRYWHLEPGTELQYRSDREYADHLRYLFSEAVRSRLRGTDLPIGAYLSGGLDSSSVVGMARELGAELETFSLMCRDDPLADESAYIHDVVDKWHLTAHRIDASPPTGDRCFEQVMARRDIPDLPTDLVFECLTTRARERGIRILLTGLGGDHLFSGSLYHYAEMLRRGAVLKLMRQVVIDSRLSDVGWSPWELFMSGVRPLLPRALKNAGRPIARRFGWTARLPPWIEPGFAARHDLKGRTRAAVPLRAPGAFAQQYVHGLFLSGWQYRLLEMGQRAASEHELELRHPFFDRRLIEFGLALPESQRWQGDTTKFVLRTAMRANLPDSVYARRNKADFSHYTAQTLAAMYGATIDHLQIATMGWVRQDCVSRMFREIRPLLARKKDAGNHILPLWLIAGVDLWYRSVFMKRSVEKLSLMTN